jgi:hypothetical protein
MKIRSVTCFLDPGAQAPYGSTPYKALDRLGKLAELARETFGNAGLEVQTTRLSTTPFPSLYPIEEVESAVGLAQALERDAIERGFNYLSVGPALPAYAGSADLILPILQNTRSVFVSGLMTQNDQIFPKMVRAYAQIIHDAAGLEPEGFANLRFAALANVAPYGPFFPGSYHAGGRPAFSLAIECADLAYSAARKASSLPAFRQSLVTTLEGQATRLTSYANHLAQQFDLDFRGIDFSLAPYPSEWASLGAALEALGLPSLGRSGSLAAAAFLADTLDRGSWLRAGFNGLMMPVLEDSTLASRSIEGVLRVHDLLMYSSVCGTGLDTVPLPGSSTPEQIYALLLDVATLALRLNKPLTARLMPIPGKQAGDATTFKFDYFANGAVMALDAVPLHGLLAGDEPFEVKKRG